MNFDPNGNLFPFEATEVSMETFQEMFVLKIAGSTTRSRLFDEYLRYAEDFKTQICPNSLHLINGSFVTKKLNPNDIDLVVFIDYQVYELHENNIVKFKRGGLYQCIEAFIEKAYPLGHPFRIRYESDLLYWNDLFTKDRKERKKGYLKIHFGHADEQ